MSLQEQRTNEGISCPQAQAQHFWNSHPRSEQELALHPTLQEQPPLQPPWRPYIAQFTGQVPLVTTRDTILENGRSVFNLHTLPHYSECQQLVGSQEAFLPIGSCRQAKPGSSPKAKYLRLLTELDNSVQPPSVRAGARPASHAAGAAPPPASVEIENRSQKKQLGAALRRYWAIRSLGEMHLKQKWQPAVATAQVATGINPSPRRLPSPQPYAGAVIETEWEAVWIPKSDVPAQLRARNGCFASTLCRLLLLQLATFCSKGLERKAQRFAPPPYP
ncbi:uncharacterized protein [Ambystoma mexicanum]|uniref:uncharacterized protein n=1 Tax=Ambystoma mexicanum TaxID=8296 RepID=UPI0037E86C8C